MRLFLLLGLAMLIAVCVSAQTKISGKVLDVKGKPLAGVSITIRDTYDGATSDSAGNYRFSTSEQGQITLVASSIGFKSSEATLTLAKEDIIQNFSLKEAVNELSAVVITAGSFEASDTKRTTVLNPIDIVTTASANADITSAIRTLPGAQQVGESEGLFVRGGTAQETKVFIDGTLVNNFFYTAAPDLASRGRFSPFIFKGTVFSSGGYSALYGQALSSALILESVDLPDQSAATLGVSTVGINAGFQKLSKNKKASWGLTYNYLNLALYFNLVKQRPDYFEMPAFHNGEANFRIKTSRTGILKFYGYFNYNQLGMRRPDIDSTSLKNAFGMRNVNYYANLSWKEKLSPDWRLYLGAAFSQNLDDLHNELQDADNKPVSSQVEPYFSKGYDVNALSKMTTIKAVLERKFGNLSAVRFGSEFIQAKEETNFSQTGRKSEALMKDDYAAAFAEADVYLTNDLAGKFGGRYEYSSLIGKSNIVPRVSLAYKLGTQGQASLAYGIFYQKPDKEFYLRDYRFPQTGYAKAVHYIANYQKVSRDYTLRAELYYKKYDNLVKTYSSNNSGTIDSAAMVGYGDAKGFELFWRDRKTFRNVDYWISYSYLHTKRDHLNFPILMQPNFATPHTANLVVKKFVTKWKTQFNGSYSFATGRPYYDLRADNAGKFQIADQGKTIAYHNLSFSVNYLPTLGSKTAKKFTVFVFSVTNVIGNNQVYGYNYSYNGLRKEAILPAARRFFFLGCFMSFGVDRSEDVINNSL